VLLVDGVWVRFGVGVTPAITFQVLCPAPFVAAVARELAEATFGHAVSLASYQVHNSHMHGAALIVCMTTFNEADHPRHRSGQFAEKQQSAPAALLEAEPVMEVLQDGTRQWLLDGILHRTDGPAIERADGTTEWYAHGLRHRTDGPAFEMHNGPKGWFTHGVLHREDGPALELSEESLWFLKGERVESETVMKLHAARQALTKYREQRPTAVSAFHVSGQVWGALQSAKEMADAIEWLLGRETPTR
jgi:hypothetical protein